MHIWSQLSFLKRKLSGLTKSPRSVHMCILYIHSEDGDYNIMRINGRTWNDDTAKLQTLKITHWYSHWGVQLSDLRGGGAINMVREVGIPCSVEQKCHRLCSSNTEMPAFSINLFARCEVPQPWVTAAFRREADDNCALLGSYAASSGNFLLTFRDNLSIPSSRVEMMVPIVCPETSIRNYHYSLRNDPEERSAHLLQPCSPCSRVIVSCIIVLSSIELYFQYVIQVYTGTGTMLL